MDPFAQVLSKASSVPKTKGGWYLKEGIEHLVRVEPRLKSLFISYELPSVYLSDLESAIENEITNFNEYTNNCLGRALKLYGISFLVAYN